MLTKKQTLFLILYGLACTALAVGVLWSELKGSYYDAFYDNAPNFIQHFLLGSGLLCLIPGLLALGFISHTFYKQKPIVRMKGLRIFGQAVLMAGLHYLLIVFGMCALTFLIIPSLPHESGVSWPTSEVYYYLSYKWHWVAIPTYAAAAVLNFPLAHFFGKHLLGLDRSRAWLLALLDTIPFLCFLLEVTIILWVN